MDKITDKTKRRSISSVILLLGCVVFCLAAIFVKLADEKAKANVSKIDSFIECFSERISVKNASENEYTLETGKKTKSATIRINGNDKKINSVAIAFISLSINSEEEEIDAPILDHRASGKDISDKDDELKEIAFYCLWVYEAYSENQVGDISKKELSEKLASAIDEKENKRFKIGEVDCLIDVTEAENVLTVIFE